MENTDVKEEQKEDVQSALEHTKLKNQKQAQTIETHASISEAVEHDIKALVNMAELRAKHDDIVNNNVAVFFVVAPGMPTQHTVFMPHLAREIQMRFAATEFK